MSPGERWLRRISLRGTAVLQRARTGIAARPRGAGLEMKTGRGAEASRRDRVSWYRELRLLELLAAAIGTWVRRASNFIQLSSG